MAGTDRYSTTECVERQTWIGVFLSVSCCLILTFSISFCRPLSQSGGSDEDHVSREAVERNAHPAEPD